MCIQTNDTATSDHMDGLVQDCSISSALAMQILHSCTKPLICKSQETQKRLLEILCCTKQFAMQKGSIILC